MALGGFLEFSSNLPTRAPLAIERIYAMTNEEDILAFEVSDEALEAAAGSEQVNYTLGACTGLSVCPG
ncbi:MAG: hypothetical protein WBM12_03085 [Pseudolabrys sp.]